ncbi:MAG: class I SAM-dependent methyltransferase [Stellaceae bacterium]
MRSAFARKPKPYRGIGMEGIIASWYAKNTAKSLAQFQSEAKRIAANLHAGDHVLEIAPGPGYLAIELAKLGAFKITGIDISLSFVRIAAANAAQAGVCIEFREGDAAALPFWENSFELVVCRAAFKNFSDPVGAVREMHRVLRLGGKALIIDLRNDVSDQAIEAAIDEMHLTRLDRFMTRATFKHVLRKRAYSRGDFAEMAKAAPFTDCDIIEGAIGFEVWLTK